MTTEEQHITIGDFRGNRVTVPMAEFIPVALAAAVTLQVGPVDKLLEVIELPQRGEPCN